MLRPSELPKDLMSTFGESNLEWFVGDVITFLAETGNEWRPFTFEDVGGRMYLDRLVRCGALRRDEYGRFHVQVEFVARCLNGCAGIRMGVNVQPTNKGRA